MSRFYDVKNIKVQIITSDGDIYDFATRHEDGISDDPASESSSETTATTGEKVYNVVPDEGTGVSLNLLYGSQEDKIMESLYTKFKSSRGDFFINMVIRDENIGQTVKYNSGVFTKRKAHKWATESGTEAQTWELKFERKMTDND